VLGQSIDSAFGLKQLCRASLLARGVTGPAATVSATSRQQTANGNHGPKRLPFKCAANAAAAVLLQAFQPSPDALFQKIWCQPERNNDRDNDPQGSGGPGPPPRPTNNQISAACASVSAVFADKTESGGDCHGNRRDKNNAPQRATAMGAHQRKLQSPRARLRDQHRSAIKQRRSGKGGMDRIIVVREKSPGGKDATRRPQHPHDADARKNATIRSARFAPSTPAHS